MDKITRNIGTYISPIAESVTAEDSTMLCASTTGFDREQEESQGWFEN